jgi:hypothetical protein
MSRITYEHIYYKNCPHFTVGRVDQWGEQGYLFFEDHVYEYHEDRKDQWGETYNKRTINQFMSYAQKRELIIPDEFLNVLGML